MVSLVQPDTFVKPCLWHNPAFPGAYHGTKIRRTEGRTIALPCSTVMLRDWSHVPVDAIYDEVQDVLIGGLRVMDNE
jgi:hypothetical protein